MSSNKTKTVAGGLAGLAAAIAICVPVIQRWEGHEERPYQDIIGVWTVCYGHTGSDIVKGKTYNGEDCTKLLEKDIEIAANGVLKVSPELADKPYILAATISLVYNIGTTAYKKSSVASNFKAGNYVAGCGRMLKYTYAGGKYVQGLANRRKYEYDICMKGAKNVPTTQVV